MAQPIPNENPNGGGHIAERCILHVGPAKTGTTALQASLYQARDTLLAHGCLYPSISPNHKFIIGRFAQTPERFGFHRVVSNTAEDIQRHNAAQMRRFETEFETTRPRVLLLSSEHMIMLRPAEIVDLAAYLHSKAQQVEVCLYARHPAYQMPSRIQEGVKGGARRLQDLTAEDLPAIRYQKQIAKFQKAFGKDAIRVYPFPGDPPERRDIVADFLDRTGIAPGADIETVSSNESLSGAAMLIADALSASADKFSGQRAGHRHLGALKGPKMRFSPDLIREAVENARPELDYLADEWGITFPDPVLPEATAQPGELFTQDAIISIAELLNTLALKLQDAEKRERQAKQKEDTA